MKKALITGITGQDGSYLAEFLLDKGYEVHGIKRRTSLINTDRIDHLYQDPHDQNRKFILHHGDLTDATSLIRIIQEVQPDEIYNLAAQSHVAVSFEEPEYTANSDAIGALRILEAIRILKAVGVSPKRTIRIALWGGEEQGLHGSRGYVKTHFGDPATKKYTKDNEKVAGYFNIDNGTGRVRGIYTQGNKQVVPIFKSWFTPFSDMIDNTTVTTNNTGGTDHLAFDAVGIPGFQFIQDPVEYRTRTHHTNADNYERLVIDDLKQISVIVASFVYNTAQRDSKLPRKAATATR